MIVDQIRQVRSFNRTVTQRVGALNDSLLDRGRPLSGARLIYEIGENVPSCGACGRSWRSTLAISAGSCGRSNGKVLFKYKTRLKTPASALPV